MPTDTQRTTMLRTLKGAPISLVMCMLLFPDRSLTGATLATLTGYDRGTVTKALRLLEELQLAQHHGHLAGWLLTPQARNLILPDPTCAGKFPAQLRSSGSGLTLLENPAQEIEPPPQQPTPPAAENFPAETQHLADWLTQRIGCPPKHALAAATAAIHRDDYPTYTKYQALRWLAYTESRHGKTLTFPYAFIAKQIERGTPCPESFRDEGNLTYDIRLAYDAWQNEPDEGDENEPHS